MLINEKLVVSILEQLEAKYPQPVEDEEYILQDHKNREEILDHLHLCYKKEWIESQALKQVDQSDLPVGYYKISITEFGKTYLNSL